MLLDPSCSAGCVEYSNVPDNLIPLVTIGGEIFQWLTILTIGTLLYYKKLERRITLFLGLTLIISWLDFPLYTINNTFGIHHWFFIGSRSGDIILFSKQTGVPLLFLNFMALLQLFVGFVVIYTKCLKDKLKWNEIQMRIRSIFANNVS
jgi:hypothetical protein